MNKIYLLDDINILNFGESITVRLKKKYHIALLNIFPTVLELIIQEYVDDIIEVVIKRNHDYSYFLNIVIKNQLTQYKNISFNIRTWFVNPIMYGICCDYIDDTIFKIINGDAKIYVWHIIFNMYMNRIYNTNKYFNKQCHYFNDDVYYKNGLLWYHDNSNVIKIHIHDHKLFKNIIVIMQCIINGILKN